MRINASNSSFSMAKIYEKNNRIDKKEEIKNLNKEDSIEISNIAKQISFIDELILDEKQKIEHLRNLIKNENYKVDSKKLTKAMLDSIREGRF